MKALRLMSTSDQIALLFLLLFGALLLLSVGGLLYSLRERERSTRAENNWRQFKRDIRAVWVGSALFWVAWVSGAVGSTILFGVLSFLALREFITLMHTRAADHRSLILVFFVLLPLQYVLVGLRMFD
ncbi:MAG TPA: phosphatidate cytidylyltransferase, partial [Burkholderiaceae bacterium]